MARKEMTDTDRDEQSDAPEVDPTVQLMRDFFERVPEGRVSRMTEDLAEYVGVAPMTVYRWRAGTHRPIAALRPIIERGLDFLGRQLEKNRDSR